MKHFVKILSLALALIFALSVVSAFAEGYRTLDEIKQSGKIIIGLFSDKKPFGYVDEYGEYQGYDVYLARRLAADLGVRLLATRPELKLGVVTALVGAPFLILLLLRERGRGA